MSVVFFFLYTFFSWAAPPQYNSPDETANAVFTSVFARTGTFRFFLPATYGSLATFIHPRSTFVVDRAIVPVGFWGLPLVYGLLAKVIGVARVPFFSALLLLLAIWTQWHTWKKIFVEDIAFWATLLFFVHPAVWYYGSRPFFPNIPFVSFLICGVGVLIHCPLQTLFQRLRLIRWYTWLLDDIVGCVLIGCSLLIRPNEALWIAPMMVMIVGVYYRDIGWRRIFLWTGMGIMTVVLFFLVNRSLYQDALGTYISSGSLQAKEWGDYLLPFGFDPRLALSTFYRYGIRLFFWLSLPAFFGYALWWFFFGKKRYSFRADGLYAMIVLLVTSILWLYYGSAFDSVFPQATIGISYVRYWLPVSILILPYVPYLFFQLPWKSVTICFIMAYVVLAGVLGAKLVYSGPDGLLAVRAYIHHAYAIKEYVLTLRNDDAIIVTDTEDKMFWPDLPVMVKVTHPHISQAVHTLLQVGQSVYYVTPVMNEKKRLQMENHWRQFGVMLGPIIVSSSPHVVYGLEVLPRE